MSALTPIRTLAWPLLSTHCLPRYAEQGFRPRTMDCSDVATGPERGKRSPTTQEPAEAGSVTIPAAHHGSLDSWDSLGACRRKMCEDAEKRRQSTLLRLLFDAESAWKCRGRGHYSETAR